MWYLGGMIVLWLVITIAYESGAKDRAKKERERKKRYKESCRALEELNKEYS